MKKIEFSKFRFALLFFLTSIICIFLLFFYYAKYKNNEKSIVKNRKTEISKILYNNRHTVKNKKLVNHIDKNYEKFLSQYTYVDSSIPYYEASYKDTLKSLKTLKKGKIIAKNKYRKIVRSIKKLDFYGAISILQYTNLSKSDSNIIASKMYILGRLYELSFNYKEAENAYIEAIRLNPFRVKYQNAIAFLYYNNSEINSAIKHYKIALTLVNNNLVQNKETLKSLLGLADSYRSKLDLNKAFIYYTHLLNLSEVINEKETRQIALLNLGEISFKKGDYANAINYFENIRITNKNKSVKKLEILSNVNLAKVYYHYGDYEKGLYYSKQVINKAKKNNNVDMLAYGYYYRCLNLEYLNDYKGAAIYCKKALNLDKDFAKVIGRPENYMKIASMLDFAASIRDYNEALNNYKKAETILDSYKLPYIKYSVYGSMATSYFTIGKRPEAMEYFKKQNNLGRLLNIQKGFSCIECNIGRFFLFGKDYKKALRNYKEAERQAIRAGNKNILAFVYADLGMLYEELGKKDLAEHYYNLSVEVHKQIYRFDHHYLKWLDSRINK